MFYLIYGSDADNYNSQLSEVGAEYKAEREDTDIEEYDNISHYWLHTLINADNAPYLLQTVISSTKNSQVNEYFCMV